MVSKIKVAAVQMDPTIMDIELNLNTILNQSRVAADNKADLIVFPECAVSGYVYSSREEAIPYMVTIPGPVSDSLVECARELGVHIITGLLEIDPESGRCYNSAILVSSEGLIGKYRKTHLPSLGIDRFIEAGDEPFQVYHTPIGIIGMHICYDCNFPENARIMTILGAEILVLPTNWPEGRDKVAKFVVNTRAYENTVHLVAVDRVGTEGGTNFIGSSKIVSALGDTLAEASSDQEEIIYADINLNDSGQNKTIYKPDGFDLDFIGDRRPELYDKLILKDK